MKSGIYSFAILTCLFVANHCFADVVWDENVDGQLSNQPGLPTLLSLSSGENLVVGDLGPGTQVQDFFGFELMDGQILESVVLSAYAGDNVSRFDMFFGAAAGTPFDGFVTTDFSSQNIGTDLLSGAGPSLLPEPYSVALQEFDDPNITYTLAINIRTIPEPGSAMVAFGAIAIGLSRRKKGT